MQHGAHPRTILLPRRAFIATLAALLAAIIAIPVLAEHIGPHRTVTTFKWERLACHYQAVYDPAGTGYYACTLELYEPPDGACPAEGDVANLFNPTYCVGWKDSCTSVPCDIDLDDKIKPCSEGQEDCRAVEKTSELPPATVSGSISCDTPGSGGWCRGGAELAVTGSEPLDGESILSIEGTRNGETFACSGAACSVPLLEGANSFTFWARSSYGDTSEMGTANGSLDSAAPSISGEVSGSAGDGGWFVSEATVSASAADPAPGSGLASLEAAVDGGGWAAYSGPIVLGDGEHTVDLRAADAAGNTSQTTQSARVDTLQPELSLSAGGSFCPGCGQTLEIVLSVDDAGSGVVEWTLTADGVGVASGTGPVSETLAWDGSGLGGGSHTLRLEARDAAGNAGAASEPFDLIVPTPKPDPPTEEPAPEDEPQPTSAGATGSTASTAPSDTPEPTATLASSPTPSSDAEPTSTPLSVPFGVLPAAPQTLPEGGAPPGDLAGPQGELSTVSEGDPSGPRFGAAAAALIAATSAFALDRLRRRRKEEAALREEMARRNAAAEAREQAQRTALAAAAAAVAAVEAAERIARRKKVEYQLAQNMARLEHLGPPPIRQVAAWQESNPDLNSTQLIAQSHLLETGQLQATQPAPGGTVTPSPPTGTATPVPTSTPSPFRAPYPPGFQPLVEPWPPISGRAVVAGAGYLWKYGRTGHGIYDAWPLRFVPMESGRVGVRVGDTVASGGRIARRLKVGYPGTSYSVGTLSRLTAGNVIRRAARNAGMAVPLVTTLASNVYEFGWGSQRDKGIWSNEFAASSMVDFGVAGLTGLTAAGMVAGGIAAAGAIGFTAIAAAPLALTIAGTAALAFGIGYLVDRFVPIEQLKADVANGLSAWGAISQNAVTIRNAAAQRIGAAIVGAADRVQNGVAQVAGQVVDGIESAVDAAVDNAGQALHSIGAAGGQLLSAAGETATVVEDEASRIVENVSQTVEEVAENVGGFFKGLFGGGDS